MCRETICWESTSSLVNQCVMGSVSEIRGIFTLIPSVAQRPLLRAPRYVPLGPKTGYLASLL